ncbi:diaminopimelate dehydrogenase [Cohnella thailandensis]|uniref:Meso-diaminopimelate D-dehydrogenase n=1 Tax=Cohnella thailandensis TaxID=557557 RepID=A0A841SSN2_9BACL|nr:diaminopimelate dehydrogenase [Cohnella thailandensis]MBB6634944.1 diaminopimelate dehydrogenase [Cohnella thailandensis]MBP1975834.1 diaminopimelate dehydrogenase [Cohnella thailandensis]
MSTKIQVGIVGYGNLGKGVVSAIKQNPDMELVGIFTRRDPSAFSSENGLSFYKISDAESFRDKIDVMILCGGSATDLPEQGPEFAKLFNTVDSFDTHAKIPEYFNHVNDSAVTAGKVAVISTGWDPGLFSINRLMAESILSEGTDYTFWGKGVSQGHSDAIRRVAGVKNGVQYTVPSEEVINRIRGGETPDLTTRDKHIRECFVVAEEGADQEKIRQEIVSMPNYFSDYDTTVNFISEDELRRDHSEMPHGGFVIRSGVTGKNTRQIIEYSLKLESNPEFTASVLTAYARAAYRLSNEGVKGAKTVFDIAPGYLSPKSPEQLRKELL